MPATERAGDLSDCELSAVVRTFRRQHSDEEFSAARSTFTRHTLQLWYGIRVDELGDILDDIVAAEPIIHDEAYGFHVFLSSAKEQRYFQPRVLQAMGGSSSPAGLMMRFGYLLDLRMRGHVKEALTLFRVLQGDLQTIHPFADRRNGWPLFLSLQQGVTAMLAGDFQSALNRFSETLARPVSPGLDIIHRNALVRSALIEAAFGNPEAARLFLTRARGIQRTSSWAEHTIDASASVAEALLERDPQQAGRMLAVIDLAELGGMWPFYVYADYLVHDLVHAHARIATRLENISSFPFPRVEGEGFPGSVIALAQASHCLYSGEVGKAKEHVAIADPDFVLTKLVSAMVELGAGDPNVTTTLAKEIRKDTVELRRAELWRISLGAQGYLAKGKPEEATNVLRELEHLFQPLRNREVNYFTQEIHTLATSTFAWWPESSLDDSAFFERLPGREQLLTEREKTVLELLALGHERTRMAETLHISLNTLKTQLRSIYRKLGASSRTDALQKAAQRGLL